MNPQPIQQPTAQNLLRELSALEEKAHELSLKTDRLHREHFGPRPTGESGKDAAGPGEGFLPQAFATARRINDILNATTIAVEDVLKSHGAPSGCAEPSTQAEYGR